MIEVLQKKLFLNPDLYIDFEQSLIMRKGEACLIPPVEWRLLLCLASNAGEIVPSTKLQFFVWNTEELDKKAELYACVSRVRKKLETDPRHPQHLLSIKNVGYMLCM